MNIFSDSTFIFSNYAYCCEAQVKNLLSLINLAMHSSLENQAVEVLAASII